MKEYPAHQFAEIFPLRGGASLIELSDSIAEHGQKEEIVLFEKQVLDGRRRQAAAIRAGKAPLYREFGSRDTDGDDPLEFSFATNYFRRDDMSEAEKVLAAVGYAKLKRGDNQHTKGEHPANAGTSRPASQKDAAAKFGVSAAAVERAKLVMEKGCPELIQAMKAETVSVSDAAAIAGEPVDVQRKAVAAVAAGTATTLKGAVSSTEPAPGDSWAMIGREIEVITGRVARCATGNVQARDLAVQGLKTARQLIGKL